MLDFTKAKPGDILLYKSHAFSRWSSRFIEWGQRFLGQAPSVDDYCHVAMIDEDPNYILEAKWPKTRRVKLDPMALAEHYDVEIWRVKKLTKAQMKTATAWARQNLGLFYDLGLFLWGAFDFKKAEVCSTYVQKAFQAAGIELSVEGPGKKLTTPDEIAANTKVIRRIA